MLFFGFRYDAINAIYGHCFSSRIIIYYFLMREIKKSSKMAKMTDYVLSFNTRTN